MILDIWKSCAWLVLFFALQAQSEIYGTDLAPDKTLISASRVTAAIKMKVGNAKILELFKQVLHSHLMWELGKDSIVS